MDSADTVTTVKTEPGMIHTRLIDNPGDFLKVEVKTEPDVDEGEDEVDCYQGPMSSSPTELVIMDSPATGSLPSIESWPGVKNFRFEIEDIGNWKKRGYTYSKILNKLYIEMEKHVAVRFFLTGEMESGSVIRALPVYKDIANRHHPVLRCPVHSDSKHSTNSEIHSPDINKHLVRSQPPARYQENNVSGRLSVVSDIRDQAPGCDYITVVYQFMCLGSCPGGLARRPINLIFSLETPTGKIVGRQNLEVRICTCPSRDMINEEEKHQKCNIKINTITSNIINSNAKVVKSKPSNIVAAINEAPVDTSTTTASIASTNRLYNKDQVYYVPVRGLENFHKVNSYAEYLDMTDGAGDDTTGDDNVRMKAERNALLMTSNPRLRPPPSDVSPAKKMCLVSNSNTQILAPAPSRYIVPIMPKPVTAAQRSLLKTISNPGTLQPRTRNITTIVLPPRPPSGQSNYQQRQLQVKEEENTDDEGEDLPDSLGVYSENSSENIDGIAEFQRTVSS